MQFSLRHSTQVFGTLTVPVQLAAKTTGALHSSAACKVIRSDYTDEAFVAEISWLANDYKRLVAELAKSAGGQYELRQELGECTKRDGTS